MLSLETSNTDTEMLNHLKSVYSKCLCKEEFAEVPWDEGKLHGMPMCICMACVHILTLLF